MAVSLQQGWALRRILVSALAIGLLILVACGGAGSGPLSPTSLSTGTALPTASPSSGYQFLYRQFGSEQDTIWRVDPAAPGQRVRVAEIPHRSGWGIVPSLSPDGRFLSYTSYPDGATDPASQSEVYVLDLESGGSDLVAQEVDLRFSPLWSPDSNSLLVRRATDAQVMILQIDLSGADVADRVVILLQADLAEVLTFAPVGFVEDGGSFYVAQVQGGSGRGTSLGAQELAVTPPADPASQAVLVVRLSEDGIARDYDLSPDSSRLAFLAQELVEGRLRFRAFVADLAGGRVLPLSTYGLGDGDHLGPLWHPDGSRVAVGQSSATGRNAAVALVSVDGADLSFLPSPDLGFDLPLSWAPDGSFLAVITMDGDSPGKRVLVLVSAAGQRIALGDGVDAVALGWVRR